MKRTALLIIALLSMGTTLLAQYEHYIYFTDRDALTTRFFKADNPSVITDFSFNNLDKPYGIVVDSASKSVFVSDATAGKIYRYNMDGTTVETVLDVLIEPLVDYPYGLAIYDGKIYWGREGGIGRCNPDGSGAELFQSWALTSPPEMAIGLAYNPDDNKLYFTNDKYDYSGGVYRINMDGTGLEEIISGTDGVAIAVDWEHDRIYYCDYLKGVCMNTYDGGNETVIDAGYVDAVIWGLVVDMYAGKIYYTDKYDDKILQANLDGSGRVDYVTGVDAYAMAWYAEDMTGIVSPEEVVSMQVYPNPAHEQILFSGLKGCDKISIVNSMGQVVYTLDPEGQENMNLRAAEFGRGLFYVSFFSGDQQVTRKLIIE